MSRHTAHLHWSRGNQAFLDQSYSRRFSIQLDGGLQIPGSASPCVVRVPMSDPAASDPEELFVAALAGCHMLWFLSEAAAAGWCVDDYQDTAEGLLAVDTHGQLSLTQVWLNPVCRFAERQPDQNTLQHLHERAHAQCFLAHSVKTHITILPRLHTEG